MDPVNNYSELKLLVKEQVSVKKYNQISAMYVSCNLCYPGFPLCSIFRTPVDVQLKRLNLLC